MMNSRQLKTLISEILLEEKKKKRKKKKQEEEESTASFEDLETIQDAWAGGENLENPVDWMKTGGIKLKESHLRRIISEEFLNLHSEGIFDFMRGEKPDQYRRRKRVHDIEHSQPGALDMDVEDTAHQLHVVVLHKAMHPNAKWTTKKVIKLPGIPGGYTDVSQLDRDRELNATIRKIKSEHVPGQMSVGAPQVDIQVWQETSADAPQFQRGGLSATPSPIPGSAGEVGVMLFSV